MSLLRMQINIGSEKHEEFIYDDSTNRILFAKRITERSDEYCGDVKIMSGYGSLVDPRDIEFVHLIYQQIPLNSLVDFVIIDDNLGNITAYDENGTPIAGEFFMPGGASQTVFQGKVSTYDMKLSSGTNLKEKVGRTITEVLGEYHLSGLIKGEPTRTLLNPNAKTISNEVLDKYRPNKTLASKATNKKEIIKEPTTD